MDAPEHKESRMAKKSSKSSKSQPASATRPKRPKSPAAQKIVGLADSVVAAATKKRDPAMDIPLRTLSNANYNRNKRIIEMGKKSATRNFFDLGKAKSFMQSVLLASGC